MLSAHRHPGLTSLLLRSACAVAILCFVNTPAAAFHDEGAAQCGICHTMHNVEDGFPVDPGAPGGNVHLLRSSYSSELCLSCHADQFGAVLGVNPLVPPPEKGGGNFVFLLEDNINDGPDGATNPIGGDAAGHNIDAPAYGIFADGLSPTSPGGNFPSSELTCSSCHDPHGNGNFRMLRGIGPVSDVAYFTYPAPVAEGLDIDNAFAEESNGNHTAYKSGMSNWCRNCHEDIHRGSQGDFHHPIDVAFGFSISDQYNQYDGSDNATGGAYATAYLATVPFEDAGSAVTSTSGANTSSRVMCLSCHRAHATSGPYAGRWDFNVADLQDDGAISGSYPIPNPYNNIQQDPLCNKCHGASGPDSDATMPME